MSQSAARKFSLAVIVITAFNMFAFSQATVRPVLRFVFYNAENFFDIYDDPEKQDNEFLPHGTMRWNEERYNRKVNAVYKVITAASEWEAPAIAGFCEIEKRSVLYDLVRKTNLARYDYGIIHEESNDPRGIDVCLIYRKDLLKLLNYKYFRPSSVPSDKFRTRSVLYSGMRSGNDTIHLLINHWPSRRGGVLSEETLRKTIAGMVKSIADSISVSSHGKAKIIVAGDFNCTPDDPVAEIIATQAEIKSVNRCCMMNLSRTGAEHGEGTYKYQGRWEMLDQLFVSGFFLKCKEGLYVRENSFSVFRPGFLLEKDPSYPGMMPFSTYRGYKYHGGFSDHLPVTLDLYHR